MFLKNQSKKGLKWAHLSKLSVLNIFWAAYLVTSLTSCITYKDIVNFQDGQDLKDGKLDSIVNFTKWTVQPEDILQINVYSSNQLEAERFNIMDTRTLAQMQRMGNTGVITEPLGYRVNSMGLIDIPIIGKVVAQGRTIEEIKADIEGKVLNTNYLPDVNVQVIFLSFRVSILGEVNSPGSFIIQSEKMSILEAIGMAKDLTLFANRHNVLVIREKDGIRTYGRINMKSREIFKSKYFYLQPNDIVYVEPHPAKVLSAPDPASRYLSAILGFVSLFTLIFSLTK
jgi:polysaccharide export outer membrane protein